MAKKPSGEERREALDPTTADILQELTERDEKRSMTEAERREYKKSKERLKRRVNWDLPVDIKERVKAIAEEEGVPESQLAAWLLSRGFESLGQSDDERRDILMPFKSPSSSPRYEFNLSVE
jgi:hypothetical protein